LPALSPLTGRESSLNRLSLLGALQRLPKNLPSILSAFRTTAGSLIGDPGPTNGANLTAMTASLQAKIISVYPLRGHSVHRVFYVDRMTSVSCR
jgi:hypothetical protein